MTILILLTAPAPKSRLGSDGRHALRVLAGSPDGYIVALLMARTGSPPRCSPI
jgi:hypothetical protein